MELTTCTCVNSATINCFKAHVSVALEPETVMRNLVIYDSGLYMVHASLCSLMPSASYLHLLMLVAMVNLVNTRSVEILWIFSL